MPSDILSITLSAYLKYYSATKIFKENNINIFYIELYSTTKVPKSSPSVPMYDLFPIHEGFFPKLYMIFSQIYLYMIFSYNIRFPQNNLN